jgi:predicted transcriptional regulator of viral defense system
MVLRNAGDPAVVALAATQDSVVTTAQLAAAGLGRNAIAHRVARGWLRRLHRGVFLVGGTVGTWSLERAALLAFGPCAVLSHRTAAAIWGMAARDEVVHVTVTTARRVRDGVRMHRVAALEPGETTRRHGLAVTTPARTLLDLAATVPRSDLERAVNEALVCKVATRKGLLASLARSASHPGARRLGAALMDDRGITRSEAERALRGLLRRARIAPPRTNVRVAG